MRINKRIKNDDIFSTKIADPLMSHMVGYLTESDIHSMLVVNKSANKIVMERAKEIVGYSGLSLLSTWFKKKNICCVCMKDCTTPAETAETGLYCHPKCKPSPNLVYDEPAEIIAEVRTMAAGRPLIFLYNTINACFKNIECTYAGYDMKHCPIRYAVFHQGPMKLAEAETKAFMRKHDRDKFIQRKLRQLGTPFLRMGSGSINVMQYVKWTDDTTVGEIVAQYKQLEVRFINFHKRMTKHYREYVRPRLYVPKDSRCVTWSAFIRETCKDLSNYKYTANHFMFDIENAHVETDKFITTYVDKKISPLNTAMVRDCLVKALVQYTITWRHFSPELCRINCGSKTEMIKTFLDAHDYKQLLRNTPIRDAYSVVLKHMIRKLSHYFGILSAVMIPGRISLRMGVWMHDQLLGRKYTGVDFETHIRHVWQL